MTDTNRCVTPGCPGDGRYSAPGRGHVEGCRHPVPTTDPAVTAAAEALWVTEHFPVDENDMRLPSRDHPDFVQMEVMTYASAENAVAAARPIIAAEALTDALHPEFGTEWQKPDGIIWKALAEREAEVRERIAAEIEAARDATSPTAFKYRDGLTDAARIVRGTA